MITTMARPLKPPDPGSGGLPRHPRPASSRQESFIFITFFSGLYIIQTPLGRVGGWLQRKRLDSDQKKSVS